MKDLEQIKSEAFDMCTSIDAQLGVVLSGLDAELISLLAQANGHETIAALDLARFITYMNKRETGRQKANG